MQSTTEDTAEAAGTIPVSSAPTDEPRIAYLHVSDGILFKRCRRKWGWTGRMGERLQTIAKAEPLWFGTGFHFALEDFYGYNQYGTPDNAFLAYVIACRRTPRFQMPMGWRPLVELGVGMLKYYSQDWLNGRKRLQTYVVDGVPQVEVPYEIKIPFDFDNYNRPTRYNAVHARGKLDRVVIDEHDRLWVLDYKTARDFQHGHLETDPQITRYMWAAQVIYDRPVTGFIYQQHFKGVPEPPRLLASGKISCDVKQRTTSHAYHHELRNLYGSITAAPADNQRCLAELSKLESEDTDRWVRRDYVYRNQHQIEAEGTKILLELEDMLDDNLALYPNPNKDCSWDCRDMQSACIALDSGGDWQTDLMTCMEPAKEEETTWRPLLPPLSQLPELLSLVR